MFSQQPGTYWQLLCTHTKWCIVLAPLVHNTECVGVITTTCMFIVPCSWDGQEGTITNMREQRKPEYTGDATATRAATSTSSLSVTATQGGVFKLSPQATSMSANMSPGSLSSLAPEVTAASTPYLSSISRPQFPNTSAGAPNPQSVQTSRGSSAALPSVNIMEEDRKRWENLLETFKGPCLLDCIELILEEVDVFSAKRVPDHGEKFIIVRQRGKVLKEKGAVTLYIERNLYEDFCRDGMHSICVTCGMCTYT